MMRPFTCCCLLLAAGAGLYTYQAKHQAELVDREIARVMKLADLARARTGVLRAEYALLNDPSRLAELATQHLPELRNTEPQQFTSLAELDRRLPPVGPPPSAAPPVSEPPDVGPPAAAPATPMAATPTIARPSVAVATLVPATPVGAQVTQAAWPTVAATVVPAANVGRAVVASQPAPPAAIRPKPLVQKVAVARRPSKADPFVTAASAPGDALARVANSPSLQTPMIDNPLQRGSGVGRSGLGGTSSLLGMARATSFTQAAAPAR